jgi:hypothetical protein
MLSLSVGIGPPQKERSSTTETDLPNTAPGGRHHSGMMGGIISERWAASNRNAGRHHLGMMGAITPESAHTFVHAMVLATRNHPRCGEHTLLRQLPT